MGLTGIVRDELFIEHNPGQWHPESPVRLQTIYNLLDSRDRPEVATLTRRFANKEEITLVHLPGHYRVIAETDGKSHGYLDADTQTSPSSFKAALAAAGGLISLTDRVLEGELDNGFAIVRPPGHHAEANRAMGFCLFNNVAIAAAYALECKGLSRVMIVDWDLHHGNGTQHSFYSDPRVLYFSTHQFPFYPGTGSLGETGRGKGLGYTVNVPLSWGHSDEDYVSIFQKLVVPLVRSYQPELILVSAGFDIYHGDPLGEMRVSSEGFAAMTRLLKTAAEEVCRGRLIFTLEGGYHIEGQASGVDQVINVLTNTGSRGKELAERDRPEPPIIEQVRRIQAKFWKL
ncbi:MAG: histone deacetylase [Pseudomonadota bacterium]